MDGIDQEDAEGFIRAVDEEQVSRLDQGGEPPGPSAAPCRRRTT